MPFTTSKKNAATNSFTSQYLAKAQQEIARIIERGAKDKSRKRDALLENYIRQFYQHAPLDYLIDTPAPMLYQAAASHWDFIRVRGEKQPRKIRVYNPTLETHGWECDHTVLEFCTEDSPFLYDSVTAELERQGLRIFQVMHPVLQIKRDKSGVLTELYGSEPKLMATSKSAKIPADVQLESAMHFQVSYIEKVQGLKQLEADIENVLQFVHLAVKDWRKMRQKMLTISDEMSPKNTPFPSEYVAEVKQFLRWLENKNYIFLGYREYQFDAKKPDSKPKVLPQTELGVFRAAEHGTKPKGLTEIPEKSYELLTRKTLIEISKSARKSVIHRPVHMDYVGIKKFDAKGNVIGECRFLGLFTSLVYHQTALQIPIMRTKFAHVLERSGLKAESHSGKALAAILENYPRDELLQIDENELVDACMAMLELSERPQAKLFTRIDTFSRFASCIVFIPRDRYTTPVRVKIASILERAYGGTVTDHYSQVTESPLARVHFMLRLEKGANTKPDMKRLQEDLAEVTSSWANGLQDVLTKHLGARKAEQLHLAYVAAFPDAYRELYHFGGTFCDINKIEEAFRINGLTMDLYQYIADGEHIFQLKMYQPDALVNLSTVMPMLENMGFEAADELTFQVKPQGKQYQGRVMWVHHFRLHASRAALFEQASRAHGATLSSIKPEFEAALARVWAKEMENDALNKLILRANLHWRDVVMLRAYCKYILQCGFPYSRDYIASAVARHPVIMRLLVNLFHAKFAPGLKSAERVQRMTELETDITSHLGDVSDVTEDRILRQFFETMRATLRTNYFQTNDVGTNKPYLSFKLNSAKVPNLPKPRPYAEIFVYAYEMEGVHLRGGKVARGGLRWSDRIEDFRTEVLGLVKAQMVKNAVIVPVGSKGGFVVKQPARDNRELFQQQGIAAYKTFLRGLLDITDNIVNGKIIPPQDVVRHDDDDPYLVVAADKGTATFSDIANGISREYGFWMDDAYASGGSAGYDHKKMGITAKGGWVSVQRHFAEMGRDTQKEDFTVVGIGDMSGDVFGNGMLLSKHIRLVGAFNHLHIFVDPNPDAAKSFAERDRLFNLPRSGWMDYNAKLIAKGGGIFERKAKSIPISKEMKQLFEIEADSLTPDELIRAMLRAKVDLLWNGGIGTYVKAEAEAHTDVGDKANDGLRINGKELRCKVVGEGGNLGFTQRARIEAALAGVRLNTDAIDNSGGVDCSDHEVNIKIAFASAIQKKTLTIKARDKLLVEMTENVSELVLKTNALQTQAITVGHAQGVSILEDESRFMRALEKKNALDRKIEFLPDEDTLKRRAAAMQGLTRPELAVLLAYSKMDLFNDLMQSQLPEDVYCERDLVAYFPMAMQKKFAMEITHHALKREIIGTVLANSIVNRMGNSFYHRMRENFGIKGCDAARAFIVTRDIFGLDALWQQIDTLGTAVPAAIQIELQLEIRRLVERATSWFLRHFTPPLNITQLVAEFGPAIAEVQKYLDGILSHVTKNARDDRLATYTRNNVPGSLAKAVANLESLLSACDIALVVRKQKGMALRDVGDIYFMLGSRLRFGWLRQSARMLMGVNHWENLSLLSQIESLYDLQMKLTQEAVKSASKSKATSAHQTLTKWLEHHATALARYDGFIEDLEKQESITSSMLTIALQRAGVLGK